MMKVDKALQDVWSWKDSIYRQSKDKTVHGIAKTIREEAAVAKRKNRFLVKQTIHANT